MPAIDNVYVYNAEDIQRILSSRLNNTLKSDPNAFSQRVEYIRCAYTANNDFQKVLSAIKPSNSARVILIPLMHEDVWMGIVLSYGQDGNLINAKYLDSKRLDDDSIPKIVLDQFRNVFPTISVQAADCLQQEEHDHTSSADYMIANLMMCALNQNVPDNPVSLQQVLDENNVSLHEHDPDYYYGFNYRKTINVSTRDDILLTLLILKRLVDSHLTKEKTSFVNENVLAQVKSRYKTIQSSDGKLHVVPKPPNRTQGFAVVNQTDFTQEIAQELRLVLWNLNVDTSSKRPAVEKGVGFAATCSLAAEFGSLAAGPAGAASRAAIAEVIMAGNTGAIATEIAGAAVTTIARSLISPYFIIPSLVMMGFSTAATVTRNHIDMEIKKAYDLCQEWRVNNNRDKLKEAEALIRKTIGLNEDKEIHSAGYYSYMQATSDQYAQCCLLIGICRLLLNRDKAYEFSEYALKHAKNLNLKYTCLVWTVKALSKQISNYDTASQSNDVVMAKRLLSEKAKQFKESYPDVIDNSSKYAMQSTALLLSLYMNKNVASEEVEKLIQCDDWQIMRHIHNDGMALEVVMQLVKIICKSKQGFSIDDDVKLLNKAITECVNLNETASIEMRIAVNEVLEFAKRNCLYKADMNNLQINTQPATAHNNRPA